MSAPLQGRAPSPEQEARGKAAAEHWHQVINDAPVQQIARLEEAAKQLVALTGTLQGLYFAVFAFSDLRASVSNAALQLLFLLPLLLWLLSLYCATQVFIPQPRAGADLSDDKLNAWQKVREAYYDAASTKLRWLQRAHLALIASFIAVVVLLGTSAFAVGSAPDAPTQVIVLTPTP